MRQLIAALVMTVVLAGSAFAADVTGKWTANTEGPNGPMELVFTFKAEGAAVSGTVTGPMGEMPMSDVKVDGDQISFTVATDQFTVVHKGTVSDSEMKLKVEISGGPTFDMVAKRTGS